MQAVVRWIGRTCATAGVTLALTLTVGAQATHPANATAQCKDGSYSQAKAERGACSGHGGVGTWYGAPKTEATFSSGGSIGLLANRGSKNKTGQHYGLGLQYELNPSLALRGEVETYRKIGDDSTGGELKVDVLSVGAIFRF